MRNDTSIFDVLEYELWQLACAQIMPVPSWAVQTSASAQLPLLSSGSPQDPVPIGTGTGV